MRYDFYSAPDSAVPGVTAKELSDLTAVVISEEDAANSPVQQSLRDEQDVNVIVRRFGVGGPWPASAVEPQFGDFTRVTDFASAEARVKEAREAFLKLPATVRERFRNDPAELISAASGMSEEAFRELVYPSAVPAGGAGAPAVPSAPSGAPVGAPGSPVVP